jgi:hypothetical protein
MFSIANTTKNTSNKKNIFVRQLAAEVLTSQAKLAGYSF